MKLTWKECSLLHEDETERGNAGSWKRSWNVTHNMTCNRFSFRWAISHIVGYKRKQKFKIAVHKQELLTFRLVRENCLVLVREGSSWVYDSSLYDSMERIVASSNSWTLETWCSCWKCAATLYTESIWVCPFCPPPILNLWSLFALFIIENRFVEFTDLANMVITFGIVQLRCIQAEARVFPVC